MRGLKSERRLRLDVTARRDGFNTKGNEMNDDFTPEQLAADPILKFFGYKHLPEHLQEKSYWFYSLAQTIVCNVPRNAERTAALRKLLEAKDCAVRAALP